MKRIKLSKWAKDNGFTYQGSYNLWKSGKFPLKTIQLKTGTILVEVDDEADKQKDIKTAIYSRVSSSSNRKNLDSQAERLESFCLSNGWIVDKVVKECASGLNDNRPKLLKLLSDKSIERIVVEHKDRLTRFGFNYIDKLYDGEIIVANNTLDKTELMDDLISIITSFCARIYGQRRAKRKTNDVLDAVKNSD